MALQKPEIGRFGAKKSLRLVNGHRSRQQVPAALVTGARLPIEVLFLARHPLPILGVGGSLPQRGDEEPGLPRDHEAKG